MYAYFHYSSTLSQQWQVLFPVNFASNGFKSGRSKLLHRLPNSTLQITKKGYSLKMHSRFTRRQFMAGTVAAGAALAVPWYFETGTAFAFYQSQGLKKFIQPLRGVGPGGIPVAAPDAFLLPLRVLPTTLFTSRSSRISYTLTSARRHCGATTRS